MNKRQRKKARKKALAEMRAITRRYYTPAYVKLMSAPRAR